MSGYGQWFTRIHQYGEAVSALLARTPDYTEGQCTACPHEHRCCDLAVSVTLFEAIGIAAFIRGKPLLIAKVREQAKAVQAFSATWDKMIHFERWFAKRRKCAFYDLDARRCAIYAVRPVACRKAYGSGDCEHGKGIVTVAEAPAIAANRARRVRIPGAADSASIGELSTVVAYVLDDNPLEMDGCMQAFLKIDHTDLPPAVILEGPYGQPVTFKFGA